ncbi:MAG: hypothetical protein ACT4P4_07845 [Betaproteobacteria bacterium]
MMRDAVNSIRRRKFLITSSALRAAPLATAQRPRALRVGTSVPDRSSPIFTMVTVPFLKRMRELGYEEGRSFIFETEPVPLNGTEAEYLRAYRELAARKAMSRA